MLLPNIRTKPSCFCHVDGFLPRTNPRDTQDGGAKMAVGDGAASYVLKAPFAAPGS